MSNSYSEVPAHWCVLVVATVHDVSGPRQATQKKRPAVRQLGQTAEEMLKE